MKTNKIVLAENKTLEKPILSSGGFMKYFFTLITLMILINIQAGVISGTVFFDDQPIRANVLIYEHPMTIDDEPIAGQNTEGSPNHEYFFGDLLAGEYIVLATSYHAGLYQSQFYNGVTDPDDATIITITDADEIYDDINFYFTYQIPEGNSTLEGFVLNDENEPIEDALIMLHTIENMWSYPYETFSDSEGYFSIDNIFEGAYYLTVDTWGYPIYFYENAHGHHDATQLYFENEDNIEININLSPRDRHSVNGTVRDEDGSPVLGALVFADPIGESSPIDPFRNMAATDVNGEYTLDLPEYDYHLTAITPFDTNPQIQFYDHQSSFYNANILSVDSDMFGINFDFRPPNEEGFVISGHITIDDSIPGSACYVEVVSSEEDWEEMTTTREDGSFIFPAVPQGTYYLIARNSSCPSVFYDQVENFDDAIVIEVNDNITNVNLDLSQPIQNGYYSCGGYINDENGEPIPNTTVIFRNSFGIIENYAISDANGHYQTNYLVQDNYDVVVTKPFYESDEQNISIDSDDYQDFSITNSTTSEEDPVVNTPQTISIEVYPNPFLVMNSERSQSNISFNIKEDSKHLELNIFNLKGQLVKNIFKGSLSRGTYTFSWDGKNSNNTKVQSGIYYSQVRSEKTFSTTKIVIIR